MPSRLPRDFFARPTITVAQELLGKALIYEPFESQILAGRIVETEAYLDADPASHAYRGQTKRNAPMFGPAGFSYIYFIYGMYYCFNIVTEDHGKAGAVLIRSLEPLAGLDLMRAHRQKKTQLKDYQLTNGPGKLCQAYGLTCSQNNQDLTAPEADLYVQDSKLVSKEDIVISTRIGIKEKDPAPWRFYIKGNLCVSRHEV